MKVTYEFDPAEDKETLVLLAHQFDVLVAIFDIKYNMKKRFRYKLEEKEIDSFDLLDMIFEDLFEKFEKIEAE